MADIPPPLAAHFGILPAMHEARVLRQLVELGVKLVGADEGSLLVYDKAKNVLVFAMTIGSPETEKALMGQKVPMGQGTTGRAAALGEVQIGAPTFHDLEFAKKADTNTGEPDVVIAAPMMLPDELIGAITAVSFKPDKRFTQQDSRIYMEFATIAALVVAQCRKISAYEDGAGAELDTDVSALSEHEALERKLLEAVGRLRQVKPHQLAKVIAVIEAVANLAEE